MDNICCSNETTYENKEPPQEFKACVPLHWDLKHCLLAFDWLQCVCKCICSSAKLVIARCSVSLQRGKHTFGSLLKCWEIFRQNKAEVAAYCIKKYCGSELSETNRYNN